jgi:hypothetical protein
LVSTGTPVQGEVEPNIDGEQRGRFLRENCQSRQVQLTNTPNLAINRTATEIRMRQVFTQWAEGIRSPHERAEAVRRHPGL